MVAIFLRLLEYHQGVLFLTTNRVKSFDKAFHSRISIALHYDDLDQDARAKIWDTFLQLAANTNSSLTNRPPIVLPSKEQISELAKHDLNGRNIKTIVRLAHVLSLSKNEPMTIAHINTIIGLTKEFASDIEIASQQVDINS